MSINYPIKYKRRIEKMGRTVMPKKKKSRKKPFVMYNVQMDEKMRNKYVKECRNFGTNSSDVTRHMVKLFSKDKKFRRYVSENWLVTE